jgi:hypothetical protein
MILRTIKSTITFAFPFRLTDFDRSQPAGTYKVDTDEEQKGSVFRRVATFLYMRHGASIRIRRVDPEELKAALDRDQRSRSGIR